MNWIRIAILAALVWVVFRAFRSFFGPEDASLSKDKPASVGQMVPCKLCGLHIPRDESILSESGEYFCCKEHQLEYKQDRNPPPPKP